MTQHSSPPDRLDTPAGESLIFLTAGEAIAIYREVRRRAGQPAPPVRDRALLEGALQRPRDAAAYGGEVDLLTLAVRSMFSVVRCAPGV